MRHYLWQLRPYFRQVAGELVFGSLAGIVMNTAVVLPAILLGRAIDAALAFERGRGTASDIGWAALAFVGGTLLSEGPRVLKRWWLITANARIRANLRSDALRGILALPLAELHQTPIGDLMARVIGDVEMLGVGVREFIIETWDTLLFSISLVVAMLLYDAGLSALVLLPTPLALLLSYGMGRWVGGRARAAREANAQLTAVLQEQLTGLRVLRLFGRADAAVAEVRRRSQSQAAANLRSIELRSGLQPLYSALITAGAVVLVWRGGQHDGRRLCGLSPTVSALRRARLSHSATRQLDPERRRGLYADPAAARTAPTGAWRTTLVVLPCRPHCRNGAAGAGVLGRPGRPDCGQIRGDHVPVSIGRAASPEGYLAGHPGRRADRGDRPGRLWQECPRPRAARSFPLAVGRIMLDGTPLEAIPSAKRAARIGYLPQEPFLFSGTIQENIMLGPPG